MRATMKKRFSLFLCVVLAATLAFGVGYSVIDGVALAEDAPQKLNSLTFVQMSDIHYFPLDYCYQNVTDPDYYNSEFYQSTTGDTKLVLESGVILNNAVHQVIEKVRKEAAAGTAPMYFIATGDLCKNGEREALIDVANALRYMQNEIRKISGYENFQVLAEVGNHDLYNTDAALYSLEDGRELIADIVTSEQFAMIFAGLGFPNASIDGKPGTLNLTSYLPESYWGSEYTSGYVESSNASNLEIHYYSPALEAIANENTPDDAKLAKYFEIGDGLNQLTYSVEIKDSDYGFIMFDSDDREATDEGKPIRTSASEIEYFITNDIDNVYYLGTSEGSVDMSTAINETTAKEDAQNGSAVYRAAKYAHITGGRLTEGVLNFAERFATAQHAKASFDEQKTLIAAFHHNILPHFEVEDDILKDFTLYNWEYSAKRMLQMGVRYIFTGHQHSSDIASYTDVEGNTLYDTETGSMVSYESPRRYMEISRYNAGGKLAESSTSSIEATDSMARIASSHIDVAEAWDQSAYDAAYEAYEASPTTENWQNVIASNPDYVAYIVQYDRLSTRNYNEYIGEEIYTRLVERILDHFLTQDTVDNLLATASNAIGGLNIPLNNIGGLTFGEGGSLQGLVDYLLDKLVYHLYPDADNNGYGDYPYKGKTYDGILPWLTAVANDLVGMEFGDDSIKSPQNDNNKGKMNLKEMAGFIMMAHATGTEVKLTATDAELQAEFAKIDETFPEEIKYPEGEDFRFKNPTDKTYRKRMTAALKDAHEQLISGKFANDLFNALLDPLFNNDDSLLKQILNVKLDMSEARDNYFITSSQYTKIKTGFRTSLPNLLSDQNILDFLGGLIGGFTVPEGFSIDPIDADNFTLGEIIDELIPIAKPLIANLIAFNLDGDNLVEILENAIHGYITQSFKVGLGGIADEIVVAYATDIFPDLADMSNASKSFLYQPYAGFEYGGTKLTYIDGKQQASAVGATFNAATQLNGRVPSRVTANFDTVDSTGSYTFKFYTAEEIYGRFKFKTSADGEWISVTTSGEQADDTTFFYDSTATYEGANGVKVEMLTQTRPAYVPLIDLGLAAITHGEIVYEDAQGNELPIGYGKWYEGMYWRDSAPSNSIIYWNVTTVTVSGLKPGTTYYYDLEGVYPYGNSELAFSLVENAGKPYYTFTTAPDSSADSFEFLAIADIQGMIDSMYSDSHKAVKALLNDERTKDFDFILNAGDMVDNGKNFRQWGMALDTYEDLFASTSQFFAAGNHEDGKNAFATYFNYTLPTGEDDEPLQKDITDGAFYSFNYANAHFTVLNTNDATTAGLGEVQYAWLENDLKAANANKDIKWKFVLMHKSLFSGGSHSYDGEVVAMRAQLVPLFAQYGVNVVFAGHDHTYTVTNLIDGQGNVTTLSNGETYTGDGVMYVTLGTLGTKFYEYGENENVTPNFNAHDSKLATLDSQTFGKVRVTSDGIEFTGYYFDRATGTLKIIGDSVDLSAEDNARKGLSAGAIAGIVIGSVAGAALIAAGIALLVINLKKKKAQA